MARDWAITIGINNYSFLQPLRYATQDADTLHQLFIQELSFQQVYKFTEESPPIAQDYGPDLESRPTRANLRRFFRTRFKKPFLNEADNLWFFFAGHGVRARNRDYLMPVEGDRSDLGQSAIPIHYISEQLRRSGAGNIILMIDACRNDKGRRSGIGIGNEKQQGVITLFSCSPEESSYEIEELQQGAFTHVLLESLRIQGEDNCATVERLYQRLRYYVPQITQQYRGVIQTPYSVIEPASKQHLILLPRQATLNDIKTIKNDALVAEIKHDYKLAKKLWVRVLAVSPADPEAIEGIGRLSTKVFQRDLSASEANSRETEFSRPDATLSSITPRSANSLTSSGDEQSELITSQDSQSIADEPLIGSRSQSLHSDSKELLIKKQGLDESITGDNEEKIVISEVEEAVTTPNSKNTEVDEVKETVRQTLDELQRSLELAKQGLPNYLTDKTSRRKVIQGFAAAVVGINVMVSCRKSSASNKKVSKIARYKVSKLLEAEDFELFSCDVIKVDETGKIITKVTNNAYEFKEDIQNTTLSLISIPFGTFQMGSSSSANKDLDKKPQHSVVVSSFLMGKYPVTQAQWKTVADLPRVDRQLRAEPSYFVNSSYPVEQVSWNEATEFCKRLSKATGRSYRLPSEAEWEYACRAGSTTPFYCGETLTSDLANYNANNTYRDELKGLYRGSTTRVGTFPSNAFGLYDMHGNVWEWCADYWHYNYMGAPSSEGAWTKDGDDSRRVLRGGAWQVGPDYCRSAKRYGHILNHRDKGLGFRVVCDSSRPL